MKLAAAAVICLTPALAAATPAVVNADAFYNWSRSANERAAIESACGSTATTCFPEIDADVELVGTGFQAWTQGEVDPPHANDYWHGNDVAWGNLAMFPTTTTGPANGLLLVFFAGCGGTPEGYTHFYLRAASLGYHVISVPYWDDCHATWDGDPEAAGTDQCLMGAPSDAGYTGQYTFPYWANFGLHYINFYGDDTNAPSVDACVTRLERFKVTRNGNDYDALVGYHFSPPTTYAGDNIHHRVLTWLEFLAATYPNQGWGQFVSNSEVRWGSVTLAGHSQGSGLVPQVLDDYPAYRGIMVSGPEAHVHGPQSGGISAPTYIQNAAPYAANLWSYYGVGDTTNAPIVIVLDNVLQLAGAVAGAYLVDGNGFVETDVCAGTGCTPPTLAQLQTSGSHKLVAEHGNHNTVILDIDGDARPWWNRPAWDYLLVGKGAAGASCIANEWCISGDCTGSGVCK